MRAQNILWLALALAGLVLISILVGFHQLNALSKAERYKDPVLRTTSFQEAPECKPFTYYHQNTSDRVVPLNIKGRRYKSGVGINALQRLMMNFLDENGWKRIYEVNQAAFVFGIFGKGEIEWDGPLCTHELVGRPILAALDEQLGLAQKGTLWRSFVSYFHFLDAERDNTGTMPVIWNYTRMHESWRFVPQTYELGDPAQRKALFSTLPCGGENDKVLIKDPREHGGRGITHADRYEELRTRYCPPDENHCIEDKSFAAIVGSLQGVSSWRLFAQRVQPTFQWDGRNFVCRVFFALLAVGPQLDKKEHTGHGNSKVPLKFGGYKVFMFDEPYFQLHSGIVSDADNAAITRNGSELDAYLGRSYVKDDFMKKVSRIVRVSIAASRVCPHLATDPPPTDWAPRCTLEAQLDRPGGHTFFAGDFLITPELDVVVLEYSLGMALRRLEGGTSTGHLAKILGEESAMLLLKENNVSSAPGTCGTSLQPKHWHLVSHRPPFPHP